MRILFVGAPGSGKSTLATQVFAALKQAGRSAELVPEWVRSDIAANGPMESIWEQYRTRLFQKEIEDAVSSTVKYIVCDSGTISPYFYATLYCDPTNVRERIVLQDMHRYLIDDLFLGRYDLIFYLPPAPAPDLHDGIRYQSHDEIRMLDQHMRLTLTEIYRLPQAHLVNAPLSGRLEEVMWKILTQGEAELPAEKIRCDVVNLIKHLKQTSQIS